MSKRHRRAEMEKKKRWAKRERVADNGICGPGVKNYYGFTDLTPENASRLIRGLGINYGGKKWTG